MAAYANPEELMKLGIQIFVVLKRGREYPPMFCDVRIKYDQNLGDLRKMVEEKLGVPPENQLLFRKGRQLRPEADAKTMVEMDMHTGFSLQGYDTRVDPDFFPPVRKDRDGYWEQVPSKDLPGDGTPLHGVMQVGVPS